MRYPKSSSTEALHEDSDDYSISRFLNLLNSVVDLATYSEPPSTPSPESFRRREVTGIKSPKNFGSRKFPMGRAAVPYFGNFHRSKQPDVLVPEVVSPESYFVHQPA